MRALVQDRYGSSDVLRLDRIDRPTPGDDDVLIEVRAASVNIGDWHLMTGLPEMVRLATGFRRPRRRVRGTDVAGTVAAVGVNVTRFQPGDEVFGVCDGSLAEYAVAREGTLAHRPAGVTVEQAAAVPVSAVTALQGLASVRDAGPGVRVLVIGASGAVGGYAVQLAHAWSAQVTGVCSAAKADFVRSLGADVVVDYARMDITRSGERYDLVLDTGGNRSVIALRRLLAPSGTLVIVGGEGGGRLTGGFERSLRALLLSPFVSQKLTGLAATVRHRDLHTLAGLIESRAVTPVIDTVYPLADAATALARLTDGSVRGKLVVTP
ncbi:NAD(P)-dependent alcohol dehydrogenase [Cryobacterium sp. PAMC25264]|uniref:NAD(P)-dependent alcohol dehydrogenase n=1 Tax=Cryobacterium sp. PAMC25264 TaxID=2861288 RepID=UPI001C63681C|nr:NAD(P)-dependent alcohol dehydrogenase [Cryobacterium sp. PAMC25264]QYF74541.1 NAD(P)-dependent alcohol dehydrogenase [Cryobacterium sp. PAMC25264]